MQNVPTNIADIQAIRCFDPNQRVMPDRSLMQTPATRLLVTAMLKSLLTHEGSFAHWPAVYHYCPADAKTAKYMLHDVVLAVASQAPVQAWARGTLMPFAQMLYQERAVDLFRMACAASPHAAGYAQPLLEDLAQTVLAQLPRLPDALRALLAVARLAIRNVVLNVASLLHGS